MHQVDRDERFVRIDEHALQRAVFRRGLQDRVDLVLRRVALRREGQIDQADVGHRHADRRTVQLALQLGQHLAHRTGRAGGGRNHAHRRGAGATQVRVDLIEDLLVVRVGVNGGHQAAFDADRVVQHLGDRRQAVGGAGRVRHDRVLGGQLVVVDAVDDGEVDALPRGRDQHLLRARIDMLLARDVVGEEAGAFEHQIDTQFLVRKVGGVALGGDADALAVDDEVVAFGGDGAGIFAVNAVTAEQPGVRLGVGEVVDRDQFEVAGTAFDDRARHQSADAAEAVDRNLHRHLLHSSQWVAAHRIRGRVKRVKAAPPLRGGTPVCQPRAMRGSRLREAV